MIRIKPRDIFTEALPKLVEDFQNKTFDKIINNSDNVLKGQGAKNIIPFNIIDVYIRLEILLGIRLSRHTDTLTEASNLLDEIYKRGETQTEQQYPNTLDNFHIKYLQTKTYL